MSINPLKVSILFTFGGLFFVSVLLAQVPDLVILNADVRTMDQEKQQAEAVAVINNKISAVGTNSEINKLIAPNTKIIDAKGKLVIPGFNDSHVHLFSIGAHFFVIDFRDAKKPVDVIKKLEFNARFVPDGHWMIGNFQTQEDFPLQIIPSKESIDAVTPNHPVLIYLKGAEVAFANSLALKIAGITNNSNGILHSPEIIKVKNKIPPISYKASPVVAETATNYAASLGVTSVQDVHSDDNFELLKQLQAQGNLKTRVYECISLKNWQKFAERGIQKAEGNAMIRHGCLKYASNGEKEQIPELTDLILAADKADLQVMIHAIGEQANDTILTVFEKVLQQNGAKDRRFRVEHARNFRPQDLKRFIATKTIASMQPFLFFDKSGSDSLLFRQMIDSNTLLSFGSDANIVDLKPLLGIWAAVYTGNTGKGISVEEAVFAYTQGSAFAEFQEKVKGSITVGKLADLVILSENIFTIAPLKIADAKVLTTIMDGKIVYQAK